MLEELIAGLGSFFLCANLGIAPELEPRLDHVLIFSRGSRGWLRISEGSFRYQPMRTGRSIISTAFSRSRTSARRGKWRNGAPLFLRISFYPRLLCDEALRSQFLARHTHVFPKQRLRRAPSPLSLQQPHVLPPTSNAGSLPTNASCRSCRGRWHRRGSERPPHAPCSLQFR